MTYDPTRIGQKGERPPTEPPGPIRVERRRHCYCPEGSYGLSSESCAKERGPDFQSSRCYCHCHAPVQVKSLRIPIVKNHQYDDPKSVIGVAEVFDNYSGLMVNLEDSHEMTKEQMFDTFGNCMTNVYVAIEGPNKEFLYKRFLIVGWSA
jgi:hypothetical protein